MSEAAHHDDPQQQQQRRRHASFHWKRMVTQRSLRELLPRESQEGGMDTNHHANGRPSTSRMTMKGQRSMSTGQLLPSRQFRNVPLASVTRDDLSLPRPTQQSLVEATVKLTTTELPLQDSISSHVDKNDTLTEIRRHDDNHDYPNLSEGSPKGTTTTTSSLLSNSSSLEPRRPRDQTIQKGESVPAKRVTSLKVRWEDEHCALNPTTNNDIVVDTDHDSLPHDMECHSLQEYGKSLHEELLCSKERAWIHTQSIRDIQQEIQTLQLKLGEVEQRRQLLKAQERRNQRLPLMRERSLRKNATVKGDNWAE